MTRDPIAEILIKAGALDETSYERAKAEQVRWGGELVHHLLEMRIVSEETLVRALASLYHLPAVALDPPRLKKELAQHVPKELAERYGLICFRVDVKRRTLDVAVSDPGNGHAVDEIQMRTGLSVRPHIAAKSAIEKAIRFVYYGTSPGLQQVEEVDLSPESELRRANEFEPLTAAAAIAVSDGDRSSSWAAAPTWSPPVPVRKTEPYITRPAQLLDPPRPLGAPAAELPRSQPLVERVPPSHDSRKIDDIDLDEIFSSTAGGRGVEARLVQVEAALARSTALVQSLLKELMTKGVLTRDEYLRLMKAK